MSGPDGGAADRGRIGGGLCLVRRPPGDPRGHPHRRRPADAVAAPAGAIVAALSAIPHIEILRVHTRVPVADPGRVTEALAARWRPTRRCGWCCTPTMRANSPPRRGPRSAACRRAAIPVLGPVRAAARRQRQRGSAGGAVPRHAGGPRQAILSAPARPRARHRAFPCADRGRPPPACRTCAAA